MNATVQAQRVLLRKLGVQVRADEVDAQVQEKFDTAFRGDMTATKQQALHILLNGAFDPAALDLNLDGLEGGMA